MKKNESESESTKTNGSEAPPVVGATDRKILLAQVAGSVASGVMSNPSESTSSAAAVAKISVDISEAILQKIGF